MMSVTNTKKRSIELIEVNGKKVSKTSTGKRKFHKKSKNGCINCKKRRVKCDETKPICLKCTKMKLDCVFLNPTQDGSDDTNGSNESSRYVPKSEDDSPEASHSLKDLSSKGNTSSSPSPYSSNNSNGLNLDSSIQPFLNGASNNNNNSSSNNNNNNVNPLLKLQQMFLPQLMGNGDIGNLLSNISSLLGGGSGSNDTSNLLTNISSLLGNAAANGGESSNLLSNISNLLGGAASSGDTSNLLSNISTLLSNTANMGGDSNNSNNDLLSNVAGLLSGSANRGDTGNLLSNITSLLGNAGNNNNQSSGNNSNNILESLINNNSNNVLNSLSGFANNNNNNNNNSSNNNNRSSSTNNIGLNIAALFGDVLNPKNNNNSNNLLSMGNLMLNNGNLPNNSINLKALNLLADNSNNNGNGGADGFQELLGNLKANWNSQAMKASIAEDILANMQSQMSGGNNNDDENNNIKKESDHMKKKNKDNSPTISPPTTLAQMATDMAIDNNNNNNKSMTHVRSETDLGSLNSPSAVAIANRESVDSTLPFTSSRVGSKLSNNNGNNTNYSNSISGPSSRNSNSNGYSTYNSNHNNSINKLFPESVYSASVTSGTNSSHSAGGNQQINSTSNATSPSPSPHIAKLLHFSQNSNLNLVSLKLFYHYCTTVWKTIVDAGISGPDIWSTDVPELAFEFPFLMHSLLAFSATHLSRTETGLESYVSTHRIEALRLLREAVLEISESNTDALVASALILIMDSLANASSSSSSTNNPNTMSPSAWIFHVKGASTILTAVWPLSSDSKFHDLISIDLSEFCGSIKRENDDGEDNNNNTVSELVCFDESIADLYPVEIDSPYLITLAYLDKLHRAREQRDFILRIFSFPALLDKTFLALLMTGDLAAMRIMRSYYKLLRGYTTRVMDKVWFLEGVSQVLPRDVDEYSGGGGMHMMLDFLGGGLPSMTTTNFADFL